MTEWKRTLKGHEMKMINGTKEKGKEKEQDKLVDDGKSGHATWSGGRLQVKSHQLKCAILKIRPK